MIDNLHFIRPNWLWFLLVILFPLFLWLSGKQGFSPWRKVCHHHLLKHILGDAKKLSTLPFLLFIIAWTLAIIAGAGPSLEKVPTPAYKITTPIVLLLDASNEMTATDIAPNRFNRAKFKIIDFLKTLQGERVALVVFSDYAYTIVPFTDDKNVVENMLNAISLLIMPSTGHNLINALSEAEKLLETTEERGQIILLTSSAGSNIAETLEKAKNISGKNHKIAVINVGIKNDDGLDIIATAGGGVYSNITVNDTDLKKVYSPSKKAANFSAYQRSDFDADEWQDLGGNILFLVLIITASAFRKAWLGCFVFWFLLYPLETNASSLTDLFLNSNQKAKIMLENNDYEKASKIFNDENWKAVADYRAKNYQNAENFWQQNTDEKSLYNAGNALALSGDYQKAIDYYNKVLSKNPSHDDASFNKKLLEKLIAKQEQEQEERQEQASSNNQENKNDNKNNDEKDNQDNQDNDNKKEKEKEGQPQQNQDNDKTNDNQKNKNYKLEEKEQALKQALERLDDNPEELLKNILLLRYQRMEKKRK